MEIENVIDIEVESVDEIEADNVADLEVEVVESGPQGDPGIQGPPGLSAYEIYLTHGGTLSEEEWLESLKGETGNTGADGKDGYTPVKGEDYFTEEDIASLNIPTKTSQLENDSGFITEETDPTVPEFIKNITEEDINNWNNAINNSEDNSDFYTFKINGSNVAFNGNFHNIDDSECYDDFKLIIEKYYGTDIQPLILLVTDKSGGSGDVLGKILLVSSTIMGTYMSLHGFSMKPDLDGGQAYITNIQVWVDYETVDGVIEITGIRLKGKEHKLLTCDNGWTYEPTGDYHPATKKYVDDAIANIDVGGSEESNSGIYVINTNLTCKDWFGTYANVFNIEISNDTLKSDLEAFINHLKDLAINGIEDLPILKLNFKVTDSSSLNNVDWQYPRYEYLNVTQGNRDTGTITDTNRPTFIEFVAAYPSTPTDSDRIFRKRLFCSISWDETDNVSITRLAITGNNDIYITQDALDNTLSYNYISKTNTTEFTPTADYHPSTKKYVDDAIANIDVSGGGEAESPMPIFEWVTGDTGYSTYVSGYEQARYVIRPDEDGTNNLKAIIQNAYDNNIQNFGILMNNTGYNKGRVLLYCKEGGNPNNLYQGSVSFTGMYMENKIYMNVSIVDIAIIYGNGSSNPPTQIIGTRYVVRFDSDKQFQNALKTYGLPKNNTTEFTPTADYHPSTKKYVDDAISTAITSVLEAEY